MNLALSKKIRFVLPANDGRPEITFEAGIPTVGQIQSVLELEPRDEAARKAESPILRTERELAQATILLGSPEPYTKDEYGMAAWQNANAKAKRWLRQLNTRELAQVFNAIWLAAMGYDLEHLESRLKTLTQKKTTLIAMKPRPASRTG